MDRTTGPRRPRSDLTALHPSPAASALPAGRSDPPAPGARSAQARRRRRVIGILALLTAVVVCTVLSIAIGTRYLTSAEVWSALTAFSRSDADVVVRDVRLPRTLLGLVVGAALGTAGALMQGLTRNPLADPGLLGVNAGAGFFVALSLGAWGISGVWGYTWFSFAGALLATVVVYAVGASGREGATAVKLVLAGVALGALLSGVTAGITLINPTAFDGMRSWSAGSLTGRPAEVVLAVSCFAFIGLVVAMTVTGPLTAMGLGDDVALALGVSIRRTRVLVLVAVTLLCGAATAGAGPISLIGLMVPHLVRWFTGPDQRWIVPYSMLGGAALLVASDVLGRVVMRPTEIPVGIVTAFVGAPPLIALVRRRRMSAL